LSGAGIERLAARRSEKPSRQHRCALSRALNLPQLLRARRIAFRGLEQEFNVDADDGEKIVQLVGDEARRLRGVLDAGGFGQV